MASHLLSTCVSSKPLPQTLSFLLFTLTDPFSSFRPSNPSPSSSGSYAHPSPTRFTVESAGFTYLGLTLEHYCHRFGVIPASERFNKIYVLGKDRSYLHHPAPTLYRPTIFNEIENVTGISFTIGTVQKSWSKLHGDQRDTLLPGLHDIGSLSRDEFIYQIQHHRAVLGLGWPVQPSTPLEALCVGTPFINREYCLVAVGRGG